MANAITLAKSYAAALDAVYAASAKTAILNTAPENVRAGKTAGSFLISKLALVGLGDYSRATGFASGDVTLTWEEHSYTYDRGRTFSVDAMDDLETAGQAFGNLAGEFVRTKVVPEIDAVRISLLAQGSRKDASGNASLSANYDASGTLSTAALWVTALSTAYTALVDNEVDEASLVCFITSAGYELLTNDASTAATTSVLKRSTMVVVPANRMVSRVSLDAGATSTAGGWSAATDASGNDTHSHINFVLMDKGAAFVDAKHAKPRIYDPDTNQTADAWKFDYRVYHDLFVYDNRHTGIYCHVVTENTGDTA